MKFLKNPINKFTGLLTLFWMIALVVLLSFNLYVHKLLEKQMYYTEELFEKNRTVLAQRVLLQRVVYLSRMMLLESDPRLGKDIRHELESVLNDLETNHLSLVRAVFSKAVPQFSDAQTSPSLAEFVRTGRQILSASPSDLSASISGMDQQVSALVDDLVK